MDGRSELGVLFKRKALMTYDSSPRRIKYLVAEYTKTKGCKAAIINVGAGWYLENHFNSEVAGLTIPFNSITNDHSDIVHGVLLDPEAYNGKDIQGISNLATPE
ncbi:hypothetical protein EsDP_00001396 [Epichloe bromicola]|uniref:Uncharacterized protein n=1 Tax=Epichloe bromicola TaxID=79588 RepID=A0ABQ0CHS0_9HYPO